MHVLAVITDESETERVETAIKRFAADVPAVRLTVVHSCKKGELSDFVDKLRRLSCDAAVILTLAGQSPYAAAYLCYLAGIPIRVGHSLEFGGAVLSKWVKTLPEEDPVDRYLSLLRLAVSPSTDASLSS